MRAVPVTPRHVLFTVCVRCPSLHAEGLNKCTSLGNFVLLILFFHLHVIVYPLLLTYAFLTTISRGLSRHTYHTNIPFPLHTSYSVYVQQPLRQHLTHMIKSYKLHYTNRATLFQNPKYKTKNIFLTFAAGAFAHF
jgi:hypothetical protein